MSFTSLFFVTFFLPAFTFIYFVIPGIKLKNIWLLMASMAFYAFGGINYLVLILIMAGFACVTGKIIQGALDRAADSSPDYQFGDEEFMDPKAQQDLENNKRLARIWLVIGLVGLIGVLAVFKYNRFLIEDIFSITVGDRLNRDIIKMGMPIGISFYTFKLISYISDVYMGRTKAGDFFHVLIYTVIFHQVTQGPITRFGEMTCQFDKRKVSFEALSNGIWRFSIGLAKKSLLADRCGELAEVFLPITIDASYSVSGAYIGSLFYMMQIYLDFSAYSDMALGLGEMIGFKYPENFNYPYIADSVRDFWRRWHISLSSFFRDYVYIPLGGSRVKFHRLIINLLAVWVLTGLWHGASWNFILWGLYYFLFIVIENAVRKLNKGTVVRNVFTVSFLHVYTLAVVFFGWILFRITDFHKLWEVLRIMLGRDGRVLYTTSDVLTMRGNIYFVLFALSVCTPMWRNLALNMRDRLYNSFRKEAKEVQNLADEQTLFEQETGKDHVLMEKYDKEGDILEEVKEQDSKSHERMVNRLSLRLRKRKNERAFIEAVYYGVRTVLMIVFLYISILSMVGASYTPFLYNQF
ncbi:MAG TPA: membrane-bound O-acyltransferase family protein [Lachnospiraceae bacterium]|nr:membrane-bound O-acyltransferase family protein [Lachnospiraceae bacterium]